MDLNNNLSTLKLTKLIILSSQKTEVTVVSIIGNGFRVKAVLFSIAL